MGAIIRLIDLVLNATKSQQQDAAKFLADVLARVVPGDAIEKDLGDFFKFMADALYEAVDD